MKSEEAIGVVFDLEDDGTWFDVEGGGRIKLRIMTPDVNKVIRKKTVKKRVDFKKVEGVPSRFEYEEVNEDLQTELFWDYIIVDWENFIDRNGEQIPCTSENKVLLISKSTRFVSLLNGFLKELTDYEEEKTAQIEKN